MTTQPNVREGLATIGVASLVLAVVGLFDSYFLSGLLLLIAAWAIAKSSRRLEQWVRDHPRLGPLVRAWRRNFAIPVTVKAGAIIGVLGGLIYLAGYVDYNWQGAVAIAIAACIILGWLIAWPSQTTAPVTRMLVVPPRRS